MIWIGVVWTCTKLETTHTNIDEKEAKQKSENKTIISQRCYHISQEAMVTS